MKCLFVIFLIMISVSANSADVDSDSTHAWFKPYLVEDNSPFCGEALKKVQDQFFTSGSFVDSFRPIYESELNNRKFIEINGKKIYLNSRLHNGCGGACERYQIIAATSPLTDDKLYEYTENATTSAPVAVNQFFTKKENDSVYLISFQTDEHDKGDILIDRLDGEANWSRACVIATSPRDIKKSDDVEILKALDAVKNMDASYGAVMGGAGSCGSMGTHYRWAQEVRSNLLMTLYRPWLLDKEYDLSREGSDDWFEADQEGLKKWALTGSFEHNAYEGFVKQVEITTSILKQFYIKKYKWSDDKSAVIANEAIRSALSAGIRFYMYSPFYNEDHMQLRKMLLENLDLSEIRKIPLNSAYFLDGNSETILNAAVSYPEALKYLLEKGVGIANTKNFVDQPNAFGKTPLMYAIQQNQLESVKMLLENGANSNATTTKPYNNCYYTLSTSNMTPLHYAVRYASPEIIQLLIDNGAAVFIPAKRDGKEELPLGWLRRYASKDAQERNPFIDAAEFAELEKKLAVPAKKQLVDLAKRLILDAEREYQSGNFKNSYLLLVQALNLEPDNERALSDMSLVGLKVGQIGRSLQASAQLLLISKDVKTQANAWFNQGLACEKAHAENLDTYFDGQYYCTSGVIHPYVQSIRLDNSLSRKNKLKDFVKQLDSDFCEFDVDGSLIKTSPSSVKIDSVFSYKQTFIAYVLHPASQVASIDDIVVKLQDNNGIMKDFRPDSVETIDLDGVSLSYYSTKDFQFYDYYYKGKLCSGQMRQKH